MFRARVTAADIAKPLESGNDGEVLKVREFWLPVHNAVPQPGGCLLGTVNGERRFLWPDDWYEDRDL